MSLRSFVIQGKRWNFNINSCLQEVESNPHGWLWRGGFKTVEEETADVVEIEKALEFKVKPEDMTELL